MPTEQEPPLRQKAPPKASSKVISVSDRSEAGRPEYFVRKGFLYYMARLIPLAVITFIILLLVGHFKGKGAVYDLMKPLLQKIYETNGSQNKPPVNEDKDKGAPSDEADTGTTP